jgi:putative GTP pyrophosphokinase
MISDNQIVAEFEAVRGDYARAADALVERLTKVFGTSQLRIHSIRSRVKNSCSLAKKLELKNYASILKVTDLIGVRVIGYFKNEIDYACKLVEEACEVDPANSGTRGAIGIDSFGYRSEHYVVVAGSCELNGSVFPIFAEIQIRTILQHAWAEMEHDLRYKNTAIVPEEIQRSFFRAAALLETADAEFVRLRADLAELSKPIMPRHISPTANNTELSFNSLQELLFKSAVVSRLDQFLASSSGGSVHFSQDTVERIVLKLRNLDFTTIGQLEKTLFDRAGEIVAHYQIINNQWHRYLGTFPEKHGNASMPRGTCITYLYFLMAGMKSLED